MHGIQWMLANHPDDIDCEYVLDEGGMGTRDMLAPDKLVFGVSVGEKQVLWLRVRARGVAGHGSQPIPDNANLILMEALQEGAGSAGGDAAESGDRADARGDRRICEEQVHVGDSAEHDVADDAVVGRRIAAPRST